MKLRLLALAAGLVVASGAQALTPAQIETARTAGTLKEIFVSGASALRLSFGAYMQEVCDTSSMHVFFDSATGAGHRAYSCNLATTAGAYTAGTPIVVYKRDAGGSGQGVNPVASATAIDHMNIVAASCTVTGTPNFTDIQVANYTCGTTVKKVSDAGISDVEPNMLNQDPNLPDGVASVDLSTLIVKPFVQGIFGVAVNKQAYLALQKTQGLDNAGAIDESDAKRPSLPTTFVRAMLTGGLTASNTNKRGWGQVISESVDASVNTKTLNVCRRAPGSGTQAASNIYFAQNPCAGTDSAAPLRTQGTVAVTGGTYAVVENGSTGNVETCLGTTVDGKVGAYGIGVLGRENNPLANGGDKGYRYVKLDGMEPVRWNASTLKGATTGNYDFVFESTLQYNDAYLSADADKLAFINALAVNVPKPASLAAADADTQQGVMSPAASWAALGQYPALTAAAKPFASRVARGAGNSCTVLKLVR